MDFVRPFVASRLRGDVLDLAGITATEVSGFVLSSCPGRAVGSAKLIVCALRSLLGWLHLTGQMPSPLAAAVPSVGACQVFCVRACSVLILLVGVVELAVVETAA